MIEIGRHEEGCVQLFFYKAQIWFFCSIVEHLLKICLFFYLSVSCQYALIHLVQILDTEMQ